MITHRKKSRYVVKCRAKDMRWCIYLHETNCVVAEFGAADFQAAQEVKTILEASEEKPAI